MNSVTIRNIQLREKIKMHKLWDWYGLKMIATAIPLWLFGFTITFEGFPPPALSPPVALVLFTSGIMISVIFLFKFVRLERRSLREMEEFWGRMSHEIKTPITGIRSLLESLKMGSVSQEKLPGFIDLALKQIKRR